jgi:hypothetical protein
MKLFESQDSKKILEIRNSKKRVINIKKIDNKTIFALKKSIDYLEIGKNLFDLLLLSKKCNESLQSKILKRIIFFYHNESLINKIRSIIWIKKLDIVKFFGRKIKKKFKI